jgi:hypothetical protein
MTAWLEKAMEKLGTPSFAIHFEGVSYGLRDPLDIFGQPSYKVFRGGYLYCDQQKSEMNLAGMKSLCDGKVIVLIDEVNKLVMIDSVNVNANADATQVEAMMQKMVPQYTKGATISYKGTQKVKGRLCHVLSATLNAATEPQASLYYLTVKESELVLMAEKREALYDVYWIGGIGKAPAKHNYTIHLPKRELRTWYGYEVTDLRF